MGARHIWPALALCALWGCSQDSATPTSAMLAPVAGGGSATVHVIFPCQMSDVILPGIKGYLYVVVDERKAGEISSCQHRTIAMAPGQHTVRLANKGFDFGDVFGAGPPFSIPNGEFFLYARGDGHSNWFLYETDAAEGRRMIASLQKAAH